ncbi:MAG: HAD-IIA family hydrolase [Oscillospiraceae bacterium]|nr:HAD-IIA family hydrolase [Oscillospiraceae bacterium]
MRNIERLKQKKLFLLDLDGTLYLDETLFDGAAEFLRCIRERGGRYLFLTNNSSKSGDAYVEKLRRLGVEAARSDFLTSVDATILYLREHGGQDKLYYVCGTESFKEQLREAGFRLTIDRDAAVDALLMGFDTELTFQKLEDACILLGRGVEYIATNPDWVCPTWYGYVPDCGSMCEMLFRATGRRPYVIGKPKPDMAYLAMRSAGAAPEETVVIGDRLYTDIACGVNAGVDTVLVLSGETKREDVETSDVKPSFILRDVKEYLNILKTKTGV